MELTRPPDLVCHPGEEQFALMLKTTKPARKLASGFEHMEARRMRVEDSLAAARQTLDRADRNIATLMSHVKQLVDEADTKVLDALSYLREASASGAASSASGATPCYANRAGRDHAAEARARLAHARLFRNLSASNDSPRSPPTTRRGCWPTPYRPRSSR
jgi:citrate synthase